MLPTRRRPLCLLTNAETNSSPPPPSLCVTGAVLPWWSIAAQGWGGIITYNIFGLVRGQNGSFVVLMGPVFPATIWYPGEHVPVDGMLHYVELGCVDDSTAGMKFQLDVAVDHLINCCGHLELPLFTCGRLEGILAFECGNVWHRRRRQRTLPECLSTLHWRVLPTSTRCIRDTTTLQIAAGVPNPP
jgi:hypothetical protein